MAGAGGQGAGPANATDPAQPGPYAIAELDDKHTVSATGHEVAIHCAHPTDGADGPYPVVIMGHGFQLPPSQYFSYVKHLASFGYVALTVDFPAGFFGNKHVDNAKDMLGGIDWAASALAGLADSNNVGASGHSLGGKAALLAATMDQRIKASITLDPVDSAMNCSAADCPDVSAMMPLPIPTGFIGETTDAAGGFQPCAPKADNFETFYAPSASPSLSVEVLGANHMSFLDDPGSCGLTCSFCKAASIDGSVVTALSRAFMVAFYQRHLKAIAGYDLYLTGAEAQTRYVQPGLAVILSK